ncbi:hypothetical protein [Caulobacter sp. UC70_42]|uniref:hypothetical protein n=1 Tax=Caulobacter sp. UC70_42 TaxID=3374551 RepID=UPI0037569F53
MRHDRRPAPDPRPCRPHGDLCGDGQRRPGGAGRRITGARGPWLWVALGLTAIESAVFAACGFKCPLTAVAVKYGAAKDGPYDTFFPERCTRHTFRVFGPVILVGVALLAWRWAVRG